MATSSVDMLGPSFYAVASDGTRIDISWNAQVVMFEAWCEHPRPSEVKLPSGDIVTNFCSVESGGANVRLLEKIWKIELALHLQPAGSISLPGELEKDGDLNILLYGKHVSVQKPENDAAHKDSICSVECSICTDDISSGFELSCGHTFHLDCLKQWFQRKRTCPMCKRSFGLMIGTQPAIGTLSWRLVAINLPGHPAAPETIVFEFDFPSGSDDTGARYNGRREKGYLPHNTVGILLLILFKIAFQRRLMFGLGTSMTQGTFRPTFNIHIKTSIQGGSSGHGYPDGDYFSRSLEALRSSGVTITDYIEPFLYEMREFQFF